MIGFSNHLWQMTTAALLVLGPLPLSMGSAARRFRRSDGATGHLCLSTLVLWCLIQISVGILLGLAHELNHGGLMAAEVVVLACGLVMITCCRPQLRLPPIQDIFARQRFDVWEMLVLSATGFAGMALLRSLLEDPIDNYDSLAYHLPIMATWYQSGSLSILDTHWDIYARYPFSWEVLCTLFLFPFGEDYLVAFPNLIAWSIYGLTVYSLSRTVGVNRLNGMAAAALVLLLPIMKVHVNTLHVDLPLGTFFLSGLYFMLSYIKSRSSIDLFLCIALIGLVCGIKTSGLVYGLVLLCPMAVIANLIAKKTISGNVLMKHAGAWVAGVGVALLVGGTWYIRNLIEVDNPLGFVTVQVGGMTIFPGSMDIGHIHGQSLAALFDVSNIAHWKTLYSDILYQLGLPFLILALGVMFFPISVLKDKRPISRFYYGGLVGIAFATGYLYWHTPFSGGGINSGGMGEQFRFAFPFIGLVAVAAAVGFVTFKHVDKYLVSAVLINAAIFVEYGIVLYVFLVTIVLAFLFFRFQAVVTIIPKMLPRSRYMVGVGMILVVAMSVGLGYVTRERRAEQRDITYRGYPKYIRDHIGLDETIAYVSSSNAYLLYGSELNRKVIYVSAEEDGFQEWVAKLKAQDVAVVAVGPLRKGKGGGGMKEFSWLQSEAGQGLFERVYGFDVLRETVLFRVNR